MAHQTKMSLSGLIPRIFQILLALTTLSLCIFLEVWWQNQNPRIDTAGALQVLAFSTFVGAFGTCVSFTLAIPALIRLTPWLMRLMLDILFTTVCMAAGSVMAAFLASAKYEGNNLFCDGEDGIVFLLSASYDICSMCYTVQRMLQALAVLYFLAFIVTVNLIGSAVRDGSPTEDLGEDGEDARGPQAMAREAK